MTHQPPTLQVSHKDIKRIVQHASAQDYYETTMLTTVNQFVMRIGNQDETITILEGQFVEFGRFEYPQKHQYDLTPHNAFEHGISRRHVQVHMRSNRLYLVDMGSSNGTFIGDAQLKPADPYLLQNGQEITLGRLPVSIYF